MANKALRHCNHVECLRRRSGTLQTTAAAAVAFSPPAPILSSQTGCSMLCLVPVDSGGGSIGGRDALSWRKGCPVHGGVTISGYQPTVRGQSPVRSVAGERQITLTVSFFSDGLIDELIFF